MRVHPVTGEKIAVAVLIGAALTGGCGDERHLTPPPLFGASQKNLTTDNTFVSVESQLDHAALKLQLSAALNDQPDGVLFWASRAACLRRGRYVRCYPARAKGTVQVSGDIAVDVHRGDLRVRIPVNYDLTVRGLRRARRIRRTTTGTSYLSISYRYEFGSGYRVKVARRDVGFEQSQAEILARDIDLAPHMAKALRSKLNAIDTIVGRVAARSRLPEGLARAWTALQKPQTLSVSGTQNYWLTGRPSGVAAGGFVTGGDGETVRTRAWLRTDLTVSMTKPIEPQYIKVLPALAPRSNPDETGESATDRLLRRVLAAGAPSRIVLPVPVNVAGLRTQIADVFPDGTKVTCQRNPSSPAITVSVFDPRISGAGRFLAVSFQATVEAPIRFAGRTGLVHLVARPNLNTTRGTISLDGVSFPVIAGPARAGPVRVGPLSIGPLSIGPLSIGTRSGTGDQELPLCAEPFTRGIEATARLDVGETLSGIVERATDFVTSSLDHELDLGARLRDYRLRAVHPAVSGLDLVMAFDGLIRLTYKPTGRQSAAGRKTLEPALPPRGALANP